MWSKTGQLKGECCARPSDVLREQWLWLRLRERSCIARSLGFWKDAGDLGLNQLLCLPFYFLRNPIPWLLWNQATNIPSRSFLSPYCMNGHRYWTSVNTHSFLYPELPQMYSHYQKFWQLQQKGSDLCITLENHHGACPSWCHEPILYLLSKNTLTSFVISVIIPITSPKANERFSNCLLKVS